MCGNAQLLRFVKLNCCFNIITVYYLIKPSLFHLLADNIVASVRKNQMQITHLRETNNKICGYCGVHNKMYI